MRPQKTEILTVRLAPDINAPLREAADREHRSLASMLEVMILAYRGAPAPASPDRRRVPASDGSAG